MKKQYENTILNVKEQLKELSEKGIYIQPLDKSVNELIQHIENINIIEQNVDAIRNEILTPIKEELNLNKKAGIFSIAGFWLGLIGIVISIGTIIYSNYFQLPAKNMGNETQKVNQKIDSLRGNIEELYFKSFGIGNNYILKSNEILVPVTYDERIRVTVLDSIDRHIEIASDFISEVETTKGIVSYGILNFYLNNFKLGKPGVIEFVKPVSQKTLLYDNHRGGLYVGEGDEFLFGQTKAKIKKIYNMNSIKERIGSNKNAILIEFSNKHK